MPLSSKHPRYSKFLEDWEKCEDAYLGQRAVKERGERYLPATSGMVLDSHRTVNSVGWHAYQAYKARAVFPEFYSESVETFLGMMWTKPPVIEVPAALEPFLDKTTIHGESVEALLLRINERQLAVGRLGLLLDLPTKPDPEHPFPYVALYETRNIINWDDGSREDTTADSLNLVVLDESEEVRNSEFGWQRKEKYRVLVLGDPTVNEEADAPVPYRCGVFGPQEYNPAELIEPSIRGNTLTKIPFVFVNSKDTRSDPDNPPLLGLAELCMAIYRGEADYRQALFMQGQDTLVVIGGDDDANYRIGAGTCIKVKQGGDAKFIGVDSQGLTEMRESLQNDRTLAQQKAGNLIDTRSKAKESGDAMSTRLGAQTATLRQIAITGAAALEQILRLAAEWIGANPDEVSVEPNLEFADEDMTGKDLVDLMSAKSMGAPIALETIHEQMAEKGMTDLTFDEEMTKILEETPIVSGGPGVKTQNNDPNYDPTKDPNSPQFVDPNAPPPGPAGG